MTSIEYSVVKKGFKENISRGLNYITFYYPSDEYNISSPYYIALPPGEYKIECWGGRGYYTGFAAYTSGIISLSEKTALYLYLGAEGDGKNLSLMHTMVEDMVIAQVEVQLM